MLIESISKGFSIYLNTFSRFTLLIFPLIIISGFLSTLSTGLILDDTTRYTGLILFILYNFLILPFLTIFSILLANDLSQNIKREPLAYYLVSVNYIFRIFILSIISAILIGLGFFLFIIPGIYLAGMVIFVNFFVILRNESILVALQESFKTGNQNIGSCIGAALFFWVITILTTLIIIRLISNDGDTSNVPFILSSMSSCFIIYIQMVLISFPILQLYRKLVT